MRPSAWLPALLFLAACGGSSDPTSPPPAPPGAPASLTIQAGDAQAGEPSQPVAVRPAVLVRDAAGHPLSGISVSFAVDSGGGSLAATSATTNASGIAAAGDWTLGSAPGRNVVTAAVTGLPALRFHADGRIAPRTLIAQSVSPGGGTLRYTKPGDLLDGLTLKVLPGSYPAATQWSIVADASILVPLPAGFSQVGPTLVIGNGQGYADSVMTLSMPMHAGPDVAIVPFYFDPASQTLEAIPLVDRTATYATLATRHFSKDLLALRRGSAASLALGPAPASAFGVVMVVWVESKLADLVGSFSTSFLPSADGWEFKNVGDYVDPSGDCEGMSVTAMYYHYFVKGVNGAPGLYHQFDQTLENQWDNVSGIRFAGSVQGDYAKSWKPGTSQIAKLTGEAEASGLSLQDWTQGWLLLTLKLTKNPVEVGLLATGAAHAVVAYAATATSTSAEISFYDPNKPAGTPVMHFSLGQFDPMEYPTSATSDPVMFNNAYALGVTAVIPLSQLDARWTEFKSGKAGQDRYPSQYHFAVYSAFNDAWTEVGDVVRTSDPKLYTSMLCPSCPAKWPNAVPPDLMNASIYDQLGQTRLSGPVDTATMARGTTKVVLVGFAKSPYTTSDKVGFVDTKPITVIYQPFAVQPATSSGIANVDYTFTAVHNGLFVDGSGFNWTVREEGKPAGPVISQEANTLTRRFDHSGTYIIRALLGETNGHVVGVDSAVIVIDPPLPVWRFTEMSSVASGPGIHDDFFFLNGILSTDMNLIEPIRARPDGGLLFLRTTPFTAGGQSFPAGVYVQGQSFGSTTSFDPTRPQIPLARNSGNTFPDGFVDDFVMDAATQQGSLEGGTFGGHTVTSTRDLTGWPGGSGPHTAAHWRVTATMNGVHLVGTITYSLELWQVVCTGPSLNTCHAENGGTFVYKFDFKADRVR